MVKQCWDKREDITFNSGTDKNILREPQVSTRDQMKAMSGGHNRKR